MGFSEIMGISYESSAINNHALAIDE